MSKVYNQHFNDIPKGAVYIGRPTVFGNPFTHVTSLSPQVTAVDTREEAVARFEDYFFARLDNDEAFKEQVDSLKGKDLICFCAPKICHGDIILKYLTTLD